MKKCPACRRVSPSESLVCECGYDFVADRGGRRRSRRLWAPLVVALVAGGCSAFAGATYGWSLFGHFHSLPRGVVLQSVALYFAVGALAGGAIAILAITGRR